MTIREVYDEQLAGLKRLGDAATGVYSLAAALRFRAKDSPASAATAVAEIAELSNVVSKALDEVEFLLVCSPVEVPTLTTIVTGSVAEQVPSACSGAFEVSLAISVLGTATAGVEFGDYKELLKQLDAKWTEESRLPVTDEQYQELQNLRHLMTDDERRRCDDLTRRWPEGCWTTSGPSEHFLILYGIVKDEVNQSILRLANMLYAGHPMPVQQVDDDTVLEHADDKPVKPLDPRDYSGDQETNPNTKLAIQIVWEEVKTGKRLRNYDKPRRDFNKKVADRGGSATEMSFDKESLRSAIKRVRDFVYRRA